jgi:hypothetical protein
MSQKASTARKKKNINHPNEFVLPFPRPPFAGNRGDARAAGVFSLVDLALAGARGRHARRNAGRGARNKKSF